MALRPSALFAYRGDLRAEIQVEYTGGFDPGIMRCDADHWPWRLFVIEFNATENMEYLLLVSI